LLARLPSLKLPIRQTTLFRNVFGVNAHWMISKKH
jgi:hypothetical protein